MPIYQYKCQCGEMVDVVQDMNEDHINQCIKCHKPMDRVFSPAPFKFTGQPRWLDPKNMNADYQRKAHFRAQELKMGSQR